MDIKALIIEKYGSINKFVDENYSKMGISRGHLYVLLNGTSTVNPTVETLSKLAELLELPIEEVVNVYINRYRNSGA